MSLIRNVEGEKCGQVIRCIYCVIWREWYTTSKICSSLSAKLFLAGLIQKQLKQALFFKGRNILKTSPWPCLEQEVGIDGLLRSHPTWVILRVCELVTSSSTHLPVTGNSCIPAAVSDTGIVGSQTCQLESPNSTGTVLDFPISPSPLSWTG